jgi:hypothetical protein
LSWPSWRNLNNLVIENSGAWIPVVEVVLFPPPVVSSPGKADHLTSAALGTNGFSAPRAFFQMFGKDSGAAGIEDDFVARN